MRREAIKLQQPYCKECGSTDVTMDAIASWDMKTQAWVLVGELDNTDCNECGGECSLKWAEFEVEPC